jgi:hypothetical protein
VNRHARLLSEVGMDDELFLQRFEAAQWAPEDWHHREHIKVAYLYLQRYSLEEAIEQIRTAIKRFNAAHQVPEALDRGYHETITQAWMRLVHFALCEYGAAESADAFFDDHPQLWQMKVLRFFYSKQRIMSAEAKAEFVAPDILELPKTRQSPNSIM